MKEYISRVSEKNKEYLRSLFDNFNININYVGWHFFLARNPPKDMDDCAHYFFACTDWEASG